MKFVVTRQPILITIVLTSLVACGGGGSAGGNAPPPVAFAQQPQTNSVPTFTISGSVGDGPIVGADISALDSEDTIVGTTTSSTVAKYSLELPSDIKLPITISARDGIDLVTNLPTEVVLLSVATDNTNSTANISFLSHLSVEATNCSKDITLGEVLGQPALQAVSFGLDWTPLDDPIKTKVDTTNVATFVLINEAIGEWFRRTSRALADQNVDLNRIIHVLTCDAVDGSLDALADSAINSSFDTSDRRIIAVAKAVEATIRLELLAGRLEVNGADATGRMNDAIQTISPESSQASVLGVGLTNSAVSSALHTLAVLEDQFQDHTLSALRLSIDPATENPRSTVDALLTSTLHNDLTTLSERIAVADEVSIGSFIGRLQTFESAEMLELRSATVPQPEPPIGSDADSPPTSNATPEPDSQPAPDPTLDPTPQPGPTPEPNSDPDPIPEPEPDPTPEQPAPEAEPDPDSQPTPEPSPQPEPDAETPTAILASSSERIAVGSLITLSWTSTNANECTASGGWSGVKAASGEESIGPIEDTQTYTLSCSGPGGSALSMLEVVAIGKVVLVWLPPTENINGTPVQGLANFRIYYGDKSGGYQNDLLVDGSTDTHTLNLDVGKYYFAVTAIDLEGDESSLSNEVAKDSN